MDEPSLSEIKNVHLLMEFRKRFSDSVLLESEFGKVIENIGLDNVSKYLKENGYRVHKKKE